MLRFCCEFSTLYFCLQCICMSTCVWRFIHDSEIITSRFAPEYFPIVPPSVEYLAEDVPVPIPKPDNKKWVYVSFSLSHSLTLPCTQLCEKFLIIFMTTMLLFAFLSLSSVAFRCIVCWCQYSCLFSVVHYAVLFMCVYVRDQLKKPGPF